ncbi:cspA [Symbiodinium necroappetens]|uniref:CspA protein n=1 Tax=Symbiodinium necroappetens TaxID=1628268 RepID=A0A812Q0T8_9DINO|nr:cspA [Symbiodinium necroappetens]CAE7885423.1 cspA [Symbiodinium sp. KB8]
MARREAWMGSGVLVRWRKEGGFGFIKPSDGSEDLFCHVSQLRQVEGTIKEGDRVRYTVTQDGLSGKRMAGNVVLDLTHGRSRSRRRRRRPGPCMNLAGALLFLTVLGSA